MEWSWDPTLFEGTAEHYVKGRLPYAPGLADAMARAIGLDGTQRLLDVGCGPGVVTLDVAHAFAEAVGLDPDPGMLAEADRLARERGVANVRWVQLRAEDLPAGLGSFDAVTFAASFHWMERELVAATVRGMLTPTGAVVHVDNMRHSQVDPVAAVVEELRVRYLGPDRRVGQGVRNAFPSGEDTVFTGAGFVGPERVRVPDGRTIHRTLDEVVHNVLSTSYTAPHLFGDRLAAFEADLRAALAGPESFPVTLPDNELLIWRP